ncbi:hypothetical protein ACHAXS_004556 [Conticribra weissflogii]
MARSKKKAAGIGAVGTCMAKFIHPRAPIKEALRKNYSKHRYENLLIVGKGTHRINKKDQIAYECRIPSIPDDNIVFKIVCSHFTVTQSPNEPFADERTSNTTTACTTNINDDRASTTNVSRNLPNSDNRAEDIARLREEGIEVDDEDVAPENITNEPTAVTGRWEKPRTCPRRADINVRNIEGSWKSKAWSTIKEMFRFAVFRMCMPEDFLKTVLIPETNKHLEGDKLTLSELYKWLGCRFFQACFVGVSSQTAWWSAKEIDKFEGAPFRLNDVMSWSRFNAIDKAIRYTNQPAPTDFEDKFHDVRQMIDAFNNHMAANYLPSWLSCLDESMNTWLNKYCPGFMVVPRKPHPYGNEYHTIADGDKGSPIMWRMKLQEGKDRPKKSDGSWAFPSPFEGHTKTAKLMLEMTEPIHGTGKVVSMDSGFCVSAGILAMHSVGVYGQALVKKRGRYWPKDVPGDYIDESFAQKELGD